MEQVQHRLAALLLLFADLSIGCLKLCGSLLHALVEGDRQLLGFGKLLPEAAIGRQHQEENEQDTSKLPHIEECGHCSAQAAALLGVRLIILVHARQQCQTDQRQQGIGLASGIAQQQNANAHKG